MITISGKNGIRATVLAHSISQAGKEMITWEIEYPRLVLAELNTHRQLSRNSFSSRAVPFLKMLDQLNGEPVRFGANQAGMQDKGKDFDTSMDVKGYIVGPKQAWRMAKQSAIEFAEAFFDAGYHKQVYNRLLEPFQTMKTVLSATEVDNFFWLRDDDAADPTLRELARVMCAALKASHPEELAPDEWHLPYVDSVRMADGRKEFFITVDEDTVTLSLDDAIKVSCARCAAVSYRNEGYDLAKSLEVYDRLVGSERKHASAFEHQATPIGPVVVDFDKGRFINMVAPSTWEPGVTHMDRNFKLWSGNFQGWVQYRKLIPGECYSASF